MPKKTVVVGMGGTGDWVLTLLKSRLYAAYGEEQVHRDVQFLLLDTIHSDTRESAFETDEKRFRVQSVLDQHEEEVAHLGGVRIEKHEYLPLTGELQDVARAIAAKHPDRQHLSWFAADYFLDQLPPAAMNITDGAGQWRQFGRIALTLSVERQEFPNRVRKLIEASRAGGDTLMFYLVCSLAGGTGAGLFLDAAALIRQFAAQQRQKCWLVAFLVLPSAFTRVLGATTMELTKTRSFAAYRELLRFQTQPGKRVPYVIQYSLNLKAAIESKVFDTVFLFDADTNRFGQVPPWKGISPSIADGLEVFIDRTAGSVILQDLINASASLAGEIKLGSTLPAQFHTMGSHKIILPARQYAARFCSQFVIELLERVLAQASNKDGVEQLRRAPGTPSQYRAFALSFVRKIPNLFTQIVDMLPDNQDHVKKLKAFANRRLEDYAAALRPKKSPQGVDLQWFHRDPLKDVQTGSAAGDDAESAAKRIVRDCEHHTAAYLERLDQIVAAVLAQLEAEIPGDLQQQAFDLLNGRIAEFPEFPVGTTLEFLNEVDTICRELAAHVLKKTENDIDNQHTGQNSPGHWQTFTSEAQSKMEGTRGFDSFWTRGKAYSAQQAYIEAQKSMLERAKLSRIFDAYGKIVDILQKEARLLNQHLTQWAQRAVLNESFSARVEARNDIAELEKGLLEAGATFTSSYGLKAYDPAESVDPSLDGYREKLYARVAKPLLETWLKSQSWEFQQSDDGEEVRLVLNLPGAGSEGISLEARSGTELNQAIFDHVRDEIFPKIVNLSIFDYFLDAGHEPETVATFLKEKTHSLFGTLRSVTGSEATHQLHLLAQQPGNEEGVRFLNDLRTSLEGQVDGATLQRAQRQDFDNPYVLTLLYLVKDIRESQVEVMEQYENEYNIQLRQRDAHLVNHVFLAEQEAASIEKEYLLTKGRSGNEGWKRLAPRIVRLLEHSGRLKQFLGLWVLGTLSLRQDPADRLVRVWMILPPGSENPEDPAAIWLTSSADEPGASLSPLLAMEQFCFAGESARPGHLIPIPYDRLERDLKRQRNLLIDPPESENPYGRLVQHYEAFLEDTLSQAIRRDAEFHREEELDDLILVCRSYLKRELGSLKRTL